MVAEDLFGPVRQWRSTVSADLDAAYLPWCAGRTVEMKRSAASRAHSSTRTRAADRLMMLPVVRALARSGRFCGIPHRRLPNRHFRLRGLHLSRHPAKAALRTASDGRRGVRDTEPSGPTGQGPPARRGRPAPAHRRPRGAACGAIGKRAAKAAKISPGTQPGHQPRAKSTTY